MKIVLNLITEKKSENIIGCEKTVKLYFEQSELLWLSKYLEHFCHILDIKKEQIQKPGEEIKVEYPKIIRLLSDIDNVIEIMSYNFTEMWRLRSNIHKKHVALDNKYIKFFNDLLFGVTLRFRIEKSLTKIFELEKDSGKLSIREVEFNYK